MKLIAIDVDGVVVMGNQGKPWAEHLERDLGLSLEQLQQDFFQPYWQKIVTGKLPLRPTLTRALETISHAPGADALIAYWFRKDSTLNTHLLNAVQQIDRQEIRLVLATNQEHERADYLWATLNLQQYFDEIYSSASIGSAKPNPEFFKAITAAESVAPHNTHLLDDSQKNCQAAVESGWNSHHIPMPEDAFSALQAALGYKITSSN